MSMMGIAEAKCRPINFNIAPHIIIIYDYLSYEKT